MPRKLTSGTLSLALCLAPTFPASAQDYRPSGFDAPRGATATIGLRFPLGRHNGPMRPTLGLTIGYGQPVGAPDTNGRSAVRQLRLVDLRLDRRGVTRAELATFDLAGPERDRRLNIGGGKKDTALLLLMVVAGMTALAFWVNGHDRREEPQSDYTPPPPVG
jgi:hypothetical protein